MKVRGTPQGRTIAQAVSRRPPTAAARVQMRVWSCGILWWTKVALGQVFSENFGFPLPVYIPSASPQSSSVSPEAGTIGQEWPQCQWSHKPNNNKKKGWTTEGSGVRVPVGSRPTTLPLLLHCNVLSVLLFSASSLCFWNFIGTQLIGIIGLSINPNKMKEQR
jgi:hypothetical protein